MTPEHPLLEACGLFKAYRKHRIEVPVIDRAGRLSVRASFQGYNSEADAEALLAALRRVFGI